MIFIGHIVIVMYVYNYLVIHRVCLATLKVQKDELFL